MNERPIVFSGHQPNFIPYMGWFYKVFQSDIFVLDDDVQFTSNDWINRNFLKISGQKTLITIPVSYEFGDPINKVRIYHDYRKESKILASIEMNYHKAPFFEIGMKMVTRHFNRRYEYLVDFNIGFIMDIIGGFGFDAEIILASHDVPTDLLSNARNIYQCETVGGEVYFSGVGGKAYNDEEGYRAKGIKLAYSDYEPVVYRQQGKGFIPDLSALDYIMNCGWKIPENWKKRKMF